MSTPVKISAYIIAITTILAVALTVLVQTQITPEKVNSTLLPLIEKSLQRNVEFGDVAIGLFTGITVADLSVRQMNGQDDFFSAQSVELYYQFWPLLLGKIVIDQIYLDRPVINCVRLSDGQFNFSDLLTEADDDNQVSSTHPGMSNLLPAAFNLLIKEINVEDGTFLYVDKFKNPKSPFRYTLDKINIRARQIAFDDPFPIDFSAVVNGSNIDISGSYNMSKRNGELTVHLAPLDLLQFAPYYRDTIPGKLGAAELALNLEVDLQPDLMTSKGTVTLNDVDLVLASFPDGALENTKIGVEYALNYYSDKQLLDISTLLLSFNNINLGAEGEIDFSVSDPFLVFTLLLQQFDLREVMQSLPIALSRDYQKYSFAGLVDGRVDLSGKLSSGADLLQSVHLSLSDVRASAENLRAGISGDIIYADQVLHSENLLLQYGDQQATFQVNAEKSADGFFSGNFKLTADRLDINKILPEQRVKSTEAESKNNARITPGRQKTLTDEIGPFNFPIDMTGTLAIDRLIYKELDFDKVTATINFKNNSLSVDNLSSQIESGILEATSVVNFGVKGLAYHGELTLTQSNVLPFVAGLFPQIKQDISGAMQLQNSFSGRGTIPENLLNNLQLKGKISLQNGEVRGASLLAGLADFLGSPDLKILSFKTLNCQYDLHDGLTYINGLLDSSKVKLIPTGTIGVDGHLDLHLDTRIAPDILDKLGVKDSLKETVSGSDGWGKLPLHVRGVLSHPRFNFDSTALQSQILEKASQKLLDKISPDVGDDKEPIRKMLDSTLDKLFGK